MYDKIRNQRKGKVYQDSIIIINAWDIFKFHIKEIGNSQPRQNYEKCMRSP